MLMHHLLLRSAERTPDKTAFVWVDRGMAHSYAQAVAAMHDMAGVLTHLGVQKGDRVTVFAHNGMDYLYAMLGAWRIGAIAALVNVKFADELTYYFADHTPKVVIYTHDMHQAVSAAAAQVPAVAHLVCMDKAQEGAHSLPALLAAHLPPGPDPEDESAIAHLSYTSGTTGKPKGACLAHEPTVRATRCIAERLRITANDVGFGPSALSSSYQLVANLLPCMAQGATAQVMRFWTQAAGWDAMDAAHASVLVGNPTFLQDVLLESRLRGRVPHGLRMGLSGGGPVPPTLKQAWRDSLKLPLVESFGQSELGGFMALGYPDLEMDDAKLGRVGPALPDKEVWMQGPGGQRLPPGQVGEIVLRGGFMWGYWGLPEKTAQATHGGLLRTGDLGLVDSDGFITMRGRRSELLVVGGVDWYPRDIEEALCQHSGVRQAALIGLPDAALGTRPVAYITRTDGGLQTAATLDTAPLLEAIAKALPQYALGPLTVQIVAEMPMTPTGKIAKAELAASALKAMHTATPTAVQIA
jgi:long-chain acyl-CoA synthetase